LSLILLAQKSGTGVLTDDARGEYLGETIYYDNDVAQLDALAPTQPHRDVDLEILAADAEGYARTYIIVPATIFGILNGRFADSGISNTISIQIPYVARVGAKRGQAVVSGAGLNHWNLVEVHERQSCYVSLIIVGC
jgi:hypothetical protein